MLYRWPANVRELEHCVAAAVALAEGGALGRRALPGDLAGLLQDRATGDPPGALLEVLVRERGTSPAWRASSGRIAARRGREPEQFALTETFTPLGETAVRQSLKSPKLIQS
jgi:DNA-binding NtrC family response regulator